MPSLAQHQSNEYTKMLIMGDSGSGKTGSLTSLVAAGYNLRILDYDNGLETLKQYVLKECPDKINNIEYRALRDKQKASPLGPIVDGPAKAFIDGIKMLDEWKYKTDNGEVIDLGIPATWGPDCILVLDSLTLFSEAGMNWAEPMVPVGRGGEKDGRSVYGLAQKKIEKILALIQSESFHTNVIVISHIKYVERQDGTIKGYPRSAGSALSPDIPIYFNSVALCQTSAGGKRTIQTAATAMIDLKNPKPFEMLDKYPIETGLADFFSVLRQPPKEPANGKKTQIQTQTQEQPKHNPRKILHRVS